MAIYQRDIMEAHSCFVKHMGFSETNWAGAFEFTQYAGFELFNTFYFPDDIEHGPYKLSPNAEAAIRRLQGPHAETLIKAYRHRRYSLKGRLRNIYLKPLHAVGLCACSAGKVLRDMWKNW